MTRKLIPVQMPVINLTNVANRTFGVEIETVGVSRHIVRNALKDIGFNTSGFHDYDKWSVVDDGSLACDSCLSNNNWCTSHSAEIVSPILTGEEGLSKLELVLNALLSIGAHTNKTCGTHVHVGAMDFVGNLYGQAVVMHRYTGFGFDVAAGRTSNDYAPVMYNHDDIKTYIESCNRGYGDRYNAVNLTNMADDKKTIEFRQLAGTLDYNTLSQWVCAVTNLVEEVSGESGCYLCLSDNHTYNVCKNVE